MSKEIKYILLTAIFLLLSAVIYAAPAVEKVPLGDDDGLVDVEWFKAAIKDLPSNVMLFDVRTPEEFAEGHVKGAVNLPLDLAYADDGCKTVTAKLKKGNFSIFMCLGGSKSGGMYYKLVDECKYSDSEKLFYLAATTTFIDGQPVIEE